MCKKYYFISSKIGDNNQRIDNHIYNYSSLKNKKILKQQNAEENKNFTLMTFFRLCYIIEIFVKINVFVFNKFILI